MKAIVLYLILCKTDSGVSLLKFYQLVIMMFTLYIFKFKLSLFTDT